MISELSSLESFSLPRCVNPTGEYVLRVFVDASSLAYGICYYAYSEVGSFLIYARGRLANENKTIPRLELCAALFAAETFAEVKGIFSSASSICFYSDSRVTLARIQADPNKSKDTYVSHRVRAVQENTKDFTWDYVPTKKNPADHITRGLTFKSMAKNDLWLHGPPVDSLVPMHFINAILVRPTPEQKSNADEKLMQMSFEQLLSFFEFLLGLQDERYGVVERESEGKKVQYSLSQLALCRAWLLIQRITLKTELECVRKGKAVPKDSPVSNLLLFIDEYGILRESRRLEHADMPDTMKHPIVLVDHPLVRSYIRHVHRTRLFHAGIQQTQLFFRRYFSIPRSDQVVRSVVSHCVFCNRFRGHSFSTPLTSLPFPRVRAAFVFEHVGADLFGPIIISRKKSSLILS